MGCPFRVTGCKFYRSGARPRESGRPSPIVRTVSFKIPQEALTSLRHVSGTDLSDSARPTPRQPLGGRASPRAEVENPGARGSVRANNGLPVSGYGLQVLPIRSATPRIGASEPSLQTLGARASPRIELGSPGARPRESGRPSPFVQTVSFRIPQEALTSLRHVSGTDFFDSPRPPGLTHRNYCAMPDSIAATSLGSLGEVREPNR